MKQNHSQNKLVCYCFGYSAEDIRKDVLDNGKSLIIERILAEKETGGCNCKIENPKGR